MGRVRLVLLTRSPSYAGVNSNIRSMVAMTWVAIISAIRLPRQVLGPPSIDTSCQYFLFTGKKETGGDKSKGSTNKKQGIQMGS